MVTNMQPSNVPRLSSYLKSITGSTVPIFAIAAIPVLLATGVAIDYLRWEKARTEVRAALDAAVLAGAQALMERPGDLQGAQAAADIFFKKSVMRLTAVEELSAVYGMSGDGRGLQGTATGHVPTTLMALAGISELDIAEESEATLAGSPPSSDLEVSLMLDVTGSMCNDGEGPCQAGTKISALKQAAKGLIDKVIWEDQSQFTSRVALVPFSTRVRVARDGAGSSIMKKLTDLGPTWSGWYRSCVDGSGGGGSEGGGNWTCNRYQTQFVNNWKIMPCVTDRFYDSGWRFGLTDDAPASGYFLNAHDGSRMTIGPDSSTTRATSATGDRRGNPATHWNYTAAGACFDVSERNEIMPLTNDAAALKARVDGLEAYGSTAGVLGTAFAWYMISPKWKDIWTGQSQPKPYSRLTELNSQGKPKLRKVAVLMTDGVYNTFRGWKEQDKPRLVQAAKDICSGMKREGIEVFTVGFELESLGGADKAFATDVLRSCASSADHFYNSGNAHQLNLAFQAIGDKISSETVRLVR